MTLNIMVMFIFVLRKLLTDFGTDFGNFNLCPSMPILPKTGNVLFHVLAPPQVLEKLNVAFKINTAIGPKLELFDALILNLKIQFNIAFKM